MKDINAHFHQNHGKSFGAQLQEDIIFIVIGCFIIYVITGIFKVIFFPFRYLLMSNEQLEQEDIQKAIQKAKNRGYYLQEYRDDPRNPMYQYRQRYLVNPQKYENDPDNEVYLEWYKAWKAGQIRDTKLYWIPDVYIERDHKKYINPDFLNYFDLQFELHKGWFLRTAFLNTVRKYFPEFTPTSSGIMNDLCELRDRSRGKHLHYQLIDEMVKLGIPENAAKKLSKMNLSGLELKELVGKVKKGIEHELHYETAIFIARRDIDPASDEADLANLFFTHTLPEFVIAAYFDDNLDNDDMKILIEKAVSVRDILGLSAFQKDENGKTPYDEILKEEMEKLAAKHREDVIDMELGSAVWTQKD